MAEHIEMSVEDFNQFYRRVYRGDYMPDTEYTQTPPQLPTTEISRLLNQEIVVNDPASQSFLLGTLVEKGDAVYLDLYGGGGSLNIENLDILAVDVERHLIIFNDRG